MCSVKKDLRFYYCSSVSFNFANGICMKLASFLFTKLKNLSSEASLCAVGGFSYESP